jgi:sarcosine oxidase, subunit beta
MMLAHNVHDVQVLKRHVHANRLNGIDNEWLTPEQAKAFCPPLSIARAALSGAGCGLQRRGGTARHDAVAWGYARAADALGVDIIQNCEVTGIRREADGVVTGVETARAASSARRRSASSRPATRLRLMAMAGVRMPLEASRSRRW